MTKGAIGIRTHVPVARVLFFVEYHRAQPQNCVNGSLPLIRGKLASSILIISSEASRKGIPIHALRYIHSFSHKIIGRFRINAVEDPNHS